jgi:hypothetical protein
MPQTSMPPYRIATAYRHESECRQVGPSDDDFAPGPKIQEFRRYQLVNANEVYCRARLGARTRFNQCNMTRLAKIDARDRELTSAPRDWRNARLPTGSSSVRRGACNMDG